MKVLDILNHHINNKEKNFPRARCMLNNGQEHDIFKKIKQSIIDGKTTYE